MKPLDHLTSAFECLWETKIHLLRTLEGVDDEMSPKLKSVLAEVGAARDRVEKLLIELQATTPAAPDPPPR